MIEYTFTLADGEVHQFRVEMERPGRVSASQKPAAWTELAFQKCSNCPLKATEHTHCPTALDFEAIAQRFSAIKSFERTTVEVRTAERIYTKHCDVQTGLRGLLGLVMATSACPISSQLKALAHFHLPFASIDETLFRVVSAYLIKQYFACRAGGEADWELAGLNQFYQDMQELNYCFKLRLDAASALDANLNAIVALNFLSVAVSSSLEDQLDKLKLRFEPK